MRMRNTLLLLLALLLAACTQPAKTAGGYMDETETVAGVLKNPQGAPLSRTQVTLRNDLFSHSDSAWLDSSKTLVTTTDSTGAYTFSSVSDGNWILSENEGDSLGLTLPIVVSGCANSDTVPTLTETKLSVLNIIRPNSTIVSAYIVQLGLDTAFGTSDTLRLKVPTGLYTVLPISNPNAVLIKSQGDTVTLQAQSSASLNLSSTTTTRLIPTWYAEGIWNFKDSTNPWKKDSSTAFANDAVIAAGSPIDSAGFLVLNGVSGLKISLNDSLKPAQFQLVVHLSATPGISTVQNIFCSEATSANSASWCLRLRDQDSLVFAYSDGAGISDSIVGSIPLDSLISITAQAYSGKVSLYVASTFLGAKATAINFGTISGDLAIGCRINQATPDRFFTGLIDYLTVSRD